jgi:radical SAM superfamily enzyme YgiQ (UPF0313 family)
MYLPIGLLSIGAVLESHGYRVAVLDAKRGSDRMQQLAARLLGLGAEPLAVGITVYTENAYDCIAIQRLVRRLFPITKILLGGAYVTPCYQEALMNRDTDIVVRGEGESTIIEVLEAIRHPGYDLSRIKGIAYRQAPGRVCCNPDRPPIRLLDQLPMPGYHLADGFADPRFFTVISTRGCPGRCIFCSAHVIAGSLLRSHSPEWLFSLLYAQYRRRPFSCVSIMDDTFTADKRRVQLFCAYLTASNIRLKWMIRTRVDVIDDDLVKALAAVGCIDILLGVESGDDMVLKSIGKNVTLEQVRQAIRWVLRYGIPLSASFVLGHPSDTLETIEKTLLMAMAVREFALSVNCGISTPYPGTPLQERWAEFGIRIVERDWRLYSSRTPIYEGRGFKLADLARAYALFKSTSFFDAPQPLLGGAPQHEFRAELIKWVAEMQHLRDCAAGPVPGSQFAGAAASF